MKTEDVNGGRVIFIQSRAARLSDDQLRLALGSMGDEDPRWLAFNQLLDRALASAMLDVTDPRLDTSKGTYPGGQVAALAELKKEIHELRGAPVKQGAKQKGRR